jgi:NADH:ubiquinone oxidoreductase subunit 5 (subunit L)/multisubunit Na+/H+ antiporter MnhA subunit
MNSFQNMNTQYFEQNDFDNYILSTQRQRLPKVISTDQRFHISYLSMIPIIFIILCIVFCTHFIGNMLEPKFCEVQGSNVAKTISKVSFYISILGHLMNVIVICMCVYIMYKGKSFWLITLPTKRKLLAAEDVEDYYGPYYLSNQADKINSEFYNRDEAIINGINQYESQLFDSSSF